MVIQMKCTYKGESLDSVTATLEPIQGQSPNVNGNVSLTFEKTDPILAAVIVGNVYILEFS